MIGNVTYPETVIVVQTKKGPKSASDIYELLSPGKAFTQNTVVFLSANLMVFC